MGSSSHSRWSRRAPRLRYSVTYSSLLVPLGAPLCEKDNTSPWPGHYGGRRKKMMRSLPLRDNLSSHGLPNSNFWEDLALETSAKYLILLVGAAGFEPTTCSTQNCRATRLRYTPKCPREDVDTRLRRRQQAPANARRAFQRGSMRARTPSRKRSQKASDA
jgi:hypothetical protein